MFILFTRFAKFVLILLNIQMKKLFLLTMIAIFILQSCFISNTTKLRGHKPTFGKMIVSENQNDNSGLLNQEQIVKNETKPETLTELSYDNPELTNIATTENEIIDLPKQKKYLFDAGCDKITFLNGNEEEVKLMEIGDDYVKYKRCDNLDGPTFTLSKSKLFMIVYSNGSKEVIDHNEQNPNLNKQSENSTYKWRANEDSNNSGRETHPLAIASFAFGLLGFIPLLGAVFGAIAIEKIKNNPEKYRGKDLAVAGFVMSLIWILIIIILIL
jgi:hypothetical protein